METTGLDRADDERAVGDTAVVDTALGDTAADETLEQRTIERPPGSSAAPEVHILLHRPFDLDEMEETATQDRGPRHTLFEIRRRTRATVHQPTPDELVGRVDRVLGRIAFGAPAWAQARSIVRSTKDGDVVLASDYSAFVVALVALTSRRRLRIACSLTWPTHRMVKLLGRHLRLARLIDVFTVNTEQKAVALRTLLQVAADRVEVEDDQTDLRFFRPGAERVENARPLVYTAGREGRDYRTFCAAVDGLDVDALVCAVSPSVAATKVMTVPQRIPDNVRFDPLEWVDFRDAYQRADVVVVPLIDRPDSPGLTVVMEAMACRRPVIVTELDGYLGELVEEGYAIGVTPGDPISMRSAIEWVLTHREEAETIAARAHEMVCKRHDSERLVDTVVRKVERLSGR